MSMLTPNTNLEPADAERRRGLRLVQARPVKVFDPISSRYVGGRTRDVSPTGLRLELPVSSLIQKGRLVHIHVGASGGPEGLAQRQGMMPARVVWIDRTRPGATLTVGVELVTRVAVANAA